MFIIYPELDEEGAHGHRERKKQRTRRAILGAAQQLMSTEGFEATTMHEVANDAEVSPASLYNYFPTKQQLLLAVIGDACAGLIDAGRASLEDPSDDPESAIRGLLHAYVEGLQAVDRDLLRVGFGVSFCEPTEWSEDLVALDLAMVAQLQTLVEHFQTKRSIAGELEPSSVALTLYGSFTMAVMSWISLAPVQAAGWVEMLDAQLEVVFRGLEPRGRRRRR